MGYATCRRASSSSADVGRITAAEHTQTQRQTRHRGCSTRHAADATGVLGEPRGVNRLSHTHSCRRPPGAACPPSPWSSTHTDPRTCKAQRQRAGEHVGGSARRQTPAACSGSTLTSPRHCASTWHARETHAATPRHTTHSKALPTGACKKLNSPDSMAVGGLSTAGNCLQILFDE
jgi:hypothetical protein